MVVIISTIFPPPRQYWSSYREIHQMIMIFKYFKIITDIPVEALKGMKYFIFLFSLHKCSRTEQYMCEGLCR